MTYTFTLAELQNLADVVCMADNTLTNSEEDQMRVLAAHLAIARALGKDETLVYAEAD